MLANKAELTKILTYHVVTGRYTPAQLAAGTPLKTLEGGTVTPSLMGSTYEVNSADVVRQRAHRQRHRLHNQHGAHAAVLLTGPPKTTGRSAMSLFQ